MKVLVTGGTGIVGVAAINALLARGHSVRALARHALEEVAQWPDGVEAHAGNVVDPESIRGAAQGCDVVLHIAGIVREEPPERTFQRINIDGTRHVLSEAKRANVARFVFVSSLGAERGRSEYHKSKHAAERLVLAAAIPATIVRLANVYGPGDEVLSVLLRMVRTLPVVPVIDGGDQPFQPICHEDAGAALALIAERTDLPQTLELAGPDVTTANEVIRAFEEITDRKPIRLPVPSFLAQLGLRGAEALGLAPPVNTATVIMLQEQNVLTDESTDALKLLGLRGTPLKDGLEKLASEVPERTPDQGVGGMEHRSVWVEIIGSRYNANELFEMFCSRFNNFIPVEAEPEPQTGSRLEVGATITLALPLRGNIQVRVQKVADGEVALATLEGHPLAGFVHFSFRDRGAAVRFEIDVYDRAANLLDFIGLRLGGKAAQRATWIEVANRVVQASGGRAAGVVHHELETIDDAQAERIEEWTHALIQRRKRGEHTATRARKD